MNEKIEKINNPHILLQINNKVEKTEITVKKQRNPGIELLRIIDMYAIIIHHILLFGKLLSKFKKYQVLHFINISCFFHICVFGLISGIVGNKTHKYSNLLYLWFCALFYSLGIHIIYKSLYPNLVNNYEIFKWFFPIIFKKYWYITTYFGMYLFLPLINKGLSIINKSELKIIVLSLIGIFIIWRDFIRFKKDPFLFSSGYSVLGLLMFYIIGAYLGKYIIIKNTNLFFHIIYLIIYISSSYLCYYLSFYNGIKAKLIIIIKLKQLFSLRINSIAMIIQGISLTLIFSRIKYNKYLSKIFIFLGPLTLGVYLIHCHHYIINFEFPKLFKNYNINKPLKTIINLIFLKGIIIYIKCLIIDYFRNLIFKFFKIRQICILSEKIIKNILNKINILI